MESEDDQGELVDTPPDDDNAIAPTDPSSSNNNNNNAAVPTVPSSSSNNNNNNAAAPTAPSSGSNNNNNNEDFLTLNNLLQTIYNNKFYWQIAKSVVIFAVALKVANDCKHIAIPMKDYEPFNYVSVCTCR